MAHWLLRLIRPALDIGLAAMVFNMILGEAANAGAIRIVALGDSLTAGYMIPGQDAFPAQLERALKARGHDVIVLNSGVSGDTVAGGLERLDWAVPDEAQAVIVELGANDALRGIPVERTRQSFETLLSNLKARKLPILIAGMHAPRNWGEDYARDFDRMFPELAEKYGAVLYPFFLDGVVMDPALNLGDGLHPTPKGVAHIVEKILPKVEELIGRVTAAPAAGR